MRANVEDRGIKGDCTPLMEAASGGYVDIVKLLIAHGADVNAQSSAGRCRFAETCGAIFNKIANDSSKLNSKLIIYPVGLNKPVI